MNHQMGHLKTTVITYEKGIYAFDQEMVRCFLILGREKALLLDTGAQAVDLSAILAELTDLPITVCLTHSDGDHTANLSQFPCAYLHSAEREVLLKKNPNRARELISIETGYQFDLGGRTLEVIHVPGHTTGSIALLDVENRILFSGDTVSYGPVFMFGQYRDFDLFEKSLEHLRELATQGKFTVIYPCHNSCPIRSEVIDELLSCVGGIKSGTLTGTSENVPMPDGEKPVLYTVNSSGILYDT